MATHNHCSGRPNTDGSEIDLQMLQNSSKPSFIKPYGVGFSARRVGTLIMGNDVPDRVPLSDGFDELAERCELRIGERVGSIVPVYELDTDGKIIHVHPS